MGQRGRRSASELGVVSVDGKPSRLAPPDHLGTDERRRFAELVANCEAGHFRPTDAALLCRYVESDALGERAARELRDGGPVLDGKASPWIVIQEKAIRAQVSLSMRLRLSPQSRLDPKTVARSKASESKRLRHHGGARMTNDMDDTDDLHPVDADALRRAMDIARQEPDRREQLDSMLEGAPFCRLDLGSRSRSSPHTACKAARCV